MVGTKGNVDFSTRNAAPDEVAIGKVPSELPFTETAKEEGATGTEAAAKVKEAVSDLI